MTSTRLASKFASTLMLCFGSFALTPSCALAASKLPETPVKQLLTELAKQPNVDRVVWLAAGITVEQCSQILELPLSERMLDPTLVRIAFEQLPNPSDAQIAALREASAGYAMHHLALLRLPQAGAIKNPPPTPQQIAFVDTTLRKMLASDVFSEGFHEVAMRVAKLFAGRPELQLALFEEYVSQSGKKNLTRSAPHDAYLSSIYGLGIGGSNALPAMQPLVERCKGPALNHSAERPLLCWQLGQKMQDKSDTLLIGLIGAALEFNAAPSAFDRNVAVKRRIAWRELAAGSSERFSEVQSTQFPSLDSDPESLEYALLLRVQQLGEINAMLDVFAAAKRVHLPADRFNALQMVYDSLSEDQRQKSRTAIKIDVPSSSQ